MTRCDFSQILALALVADADDTASEDSPPP